MFCCSLVGKVQYPPTQATTQTGKPMACCKVEVQQAFSQYPARYLVCAYGEKTIAAICALHAGDQVAVTSCRPISAKIKTGKQNAYAECQITADSIDLLGIPEGEPMPAPAEESMPAPAPTIESGIPF